jgi:hypothetical protein
MDDQKDGVRVSDYKRRGDRDDGVARWYRGPTPLASPPSHLLREEGVLLVILFFTLLIFFTAHFVNRISIHFNAFCVTID